MKTNAHTNEDFKKILKTLFSEKKRSQELEKELSALREQSPLQEKFLSKLSETDEEKLKEQLEKVKPALKKLAEDLQAAREEVSSLKTELESLADAKEKQASLTLTFEEMQKRNAELEELFFKSGEERLRGDRQEKERLLLEDELKKTQMATVLLRQEKISLQEAFDAQQRIVKAQEQKIEEVKGEEIKEIHRLEGERQRLIERLADTLTQSQRLSEIIKDHKESEVRLREEADLNLELKKKAEEIIYDLRAKFAQAVLESKSYAAALEEVRKEKTALESRIHLLEEEAEKEKAVWAQKNQKIAHEESRETHEELSLLRAGLQKARAEIDERDGEIRKAQQHLAKKVKETTVLRDLIERQKIQMLEMQTALNNHRAEVERLQNNLNLQRLHEEKMEGMVKERAQVAESTAKEWQEKFFHLQNTWQSAKEELQHLQKMQRNYEQMSAAFANLKTAFGKTFDAISPEPGASEHSKISEDELEI